MYTPTYTKKGQLTHSHQCKMVFGRKDAECPRCQELLNGTSVARKGWQAEYYANKKGEEEAKIESIRNHDCKKHGCLNVCVAFDH